MMSISEFDDNISTKTIAAVVTTFVMLLLSPILTILAAPLILAILCFISQWSASNLFPLCNHMQIDTSYDIWDEKYYKYMRMKEQKEQVAMWVNIGNVISKSAKSDKLSIFCSPKVTNIPGVSPS